MHNTIFFFLEHVLFEYEPMGNEKFNRSNFFCSDLLTLQWTAEDDKELKCRATQFPSQWETIGRTLGSNPTHCVERYETLLDMASIEARYATTKAEKGREVKAMLQSF